MYDNGAREILFSNGTRKEISADGQLIVVSILQWRYETILSYLTVFYINFRLRGCIIMVLGRYSSLMERGRKSLPMASR